MNDPVIKVGDIIFYLDNVNSPYIILSIMKRKEDKEVILSIKYLDDLDKRYKYTFELSALKSLINRKKRRIQRVKI